jgi:DNA-binding transcriptional LysR family regulator
MLNEIDLSRVDLNLLVLFEAVLKEGHVGRTAERLNLSPSAVSHGLGRLRRLLGDPLFLKTPKGVVPTARSLELAEPVADLLARIRRVIATAEPFDPSRSSRRFTIGAPDGISAVLLPKLLATVGRNAPGIDIATRQVLPMPGSVWQSAFADLENRSVDIAILPVDDVPVRFAHRVIYEEDFVIASKTGHRFRRSPTLENFCGMRHLLVSQSGDASGFVDQYLAKKNLARRVAVTVPNFMLAISLLAETDYISALPRSFVAMYGKRFGVVATEPPLPLGAFKVRAVVPKTALMDAGIAWMWDLLAARQASGKR